MTHPVTPPPELVQQWFDQAELATNRIHCIATRAAQWGADQELEACCQALYDRYDSVRHATRFPGSDMSDWLRAARRPKPPSLKRVALLQLDTLNADLALEGKGVDLSQIRRALEQLDD